MAEAKKDNVPVKKRRGISTARLYREVKEFVSTHGLTAEQSINDLQEALKDQVLEDLNIS